MTSIVTHDIYLQSRVTKLSLIHVTISEMDTSNIHKHDHINMTTHFPGLLQGLQ
jgi:hypothetical protein